MARLVMGLVLLTFTGQLAAATPTSIAQPNVDGQFRAYWMDSFGPGLYTEAQIEQLIQDTKSANLNAIVAQITRRGDCLCNLSVMTRTEAEIDPYPFDPLQTLIERAHAAGLEVHAWLNASIMWGSETPPLDPAHVFHTHGPHAQGRENWVMLRHDGANRGANLYFFDPGHPEAADYIVRMYLSIVSNYAVDGIHFDFIRYPDYNPGINIPAWGYNPVALARFQASTGRVDVPEPADPQWMAWRRDQVTSIVRRVYLDAYEINPRIRVSAATITYGPAQQAPGGWTQSRPFREVLQDWRGWMEEGILDLNIPMNYRPAQATSEPTSPCPMYEEWNEFTRAHQFNRQAAIGTGLYLNSVEDNLAQIRSALAVSASGDRAAGWVGFSYRAPDRSVAQRVRTPEDGRLLLSRALTNELFAQPVSVPDMPWKTQPVTGHLRGTVLTEERAAADQVDIDVYNAATGRIVASRRTDGSGWFGFVDLPPGGYKVSVERAPLMGTASAVVTVAAGSLTSVSLTLSR